jgi:uncharacterized MAPEG superfamily protein
MIEFNTVTREFRSLVDRRRDIQTFIGSSFAAMSLFLGNVLEGKLPPTLRSVQEHVFAFYALVLLVLSLILSLRLARLHGGMVLNGVLYAHLMKASGGHADPLKAARHNFFSVSFLQFILVDLLAGFTAAILALSLNQELTLAIAGGTGVFVLWMAIYSWFHARAVHFARKKTTSDQACPVPPADWREHVSLSLTQANHSLIAEIAFAGLMVFSGFGALSSLGKIEADKTDLTADFVKVHGPLWFAMMMSVTCLFELVIYLRVRVAIGRFSLQLDPTDRPFRLLRLTDSLLGYILLAFLFAVSLHVLLVQLLPNVRLRFIAGIDAGVMILAVLVEQTTLAVAGTAHRAQSPAADQPRPQADA